MKGTRVRVYVQDTGGGGGGGRLLMMTYFSYLDRVRVCVYINQHRCCAVVRTRDDLLAYRNSRD